MKRLATLSKGCLGIYILILSLTASAQQPTALDGKVFDAVTREPLAMASITTDAGKTYLSDPNGVFSVPAGTRTITVKFTGYASQTQKTGAGSSLLIALQPALQELQQVTVNSANKTAQKRSEAPVAIATISKQTMEDTRAQRIDQLVNKVSGVFMVNLGNEQHEMSIRQPMTTKSVFLYMEDGIPIRTTGVYNHNALLEMNLPAARSIEVIKGPSSALYGAEAIAGAVNIITQAAPAVTSGSVSVQANNNGYQRTDLQVGTATGKWGLLASGYYANRTNGQVDYSDFHKTAITLRTDYKPNTKTT
ncbi:MAG TPA: TonB-dependent receptor plug domain-containing protein, partial [Sediminibacterium sp.]|nr:TonB-dependent receptor plug domain-containing protein [Sediminibacterium sp.]